MEDKKEKKKHPSIPSNYVTLVQLQEKWIKQQQRKQKQKQQQQQEKTEEKQIVRRNRNNTPEKAVVAAVFVVKNNDCAEKEINSEKSSSSSSKKKKKKKNNWERKNKEGTKSRAQEEEKKEEVTEGETHAPPLVSTEKENASARREWEMKGMRSEYRPKTDNVVAVVQSESGVEIERKFGDLSMNNRSGGGVRNDGFVRVNGNLNRGVRRGNYGRFGGYWREQRRRSEPSLMWVKKREIVDGNQSSSSSIKELE